MQYIKLHRKMLDSQDFFDEEQPITKTLAWIYLLLLASYKDSVTTIDRGIYVNLKKGQVKESQAKLAELWNWSRRKVKEFLDELEEKKQITQEKLNSKQNVITIINYKKYQEYMGVEDEQLALITQEKTKDLIVKKQKPLVVKKKQYLDYVFLTDTEYDSLVKRYGENKTKRLIEKLDNYIPNSERRKPYKCHYRAICGWVSKEIEKEEKYNSKNIGYKTISSQNIVYQMEELEKRRELS